MPCHSSKVGFNLLGKIATSRSKVKTRSCTKSLNSAPTPFKHRGNRNKTIHSTENIAAEAKIPAVADFNLAREFIRAHTAAFSFGSFLFFHL
jgi:hypothetical protein